MGQVVAKTHPFRQDSVKNFYVEEWVTLDKIIEAAGFQEIQHPQLRVEINGVEVPSEYWAKIKPKPHVMTTIAVVPSGGDSGKTIIRLVALVALSVYGGPLGASLAGNLGIAATSTFAIGLVQAGVYLAGALAINALFPIATAGTSKDNNESPSFGISGTRNSGRPYGAIPRIYGRHRIYPPLAAEPYIRAVQDNTILYQLFDMGYGPIQCSEFKIGDRSVSQLRGVSLKVHEAVFDGKNLKYFSEDISTVTQSILMEQYEEILLTSAPDIDAVELDISFPGGLFKVDGTSGKRKAETVDVKLQFKKFGDTVWRAFGVTDYRFSGSVRISQSNDYGSPLRPGDEDNDGPLPFVLAVDTGDGEPGNGPEDEFKEGYVPDAVVSLLGSVISEPDYDSGTPINKTGTRPFVGFKTGTQVLKGIVSSGSLIEGYTFENDGEIYYVAGIQPLPTDVGYLVENDYLIPHNGDGDQDSIDTTETVAAQAQATAQLEGRVLPVSFNPRLRKIQAAVPGEPVEIILDRALISDLITEETTLSDDSTLEDPLYVSNGTYAKTMFQNSSNIFGIDRKTSRSLTLTTVLRFDERAQYEIRVIRQTATGDDRSSYASFISALRSIKSEYPILFDVPHTIIELEIKATDQLSGMVDTFNCIGEAKLRRYIGNDVFTQPEVTSNPAWAYLDVLTGTVNPRPLGDDRVDLDGLLRWANYCSQRSPRSAESYFRLDAIFDFSSTIFEILKTIASSGRASVTQIDGKYSVIFDEQPIVPVQMFTSANVLSFTGAKKFNEIPDALVAKFTDPESDWKPREITVYNEGFNAKNAAKFETIELFGVTRHTQAVRDTTYHLSQFILRPEDFTIKTDLENLVCKRGDFVVFQHDVPRIGGVPTRILEVISDRVVLNEPVDLIEGFDYSYKTRTLANEVFEGSIIEQIDEFTIRIDQTNLPVLRGDLFTWGFTEHVTIDCLVKSITPESDFNATMVLIPLAVELYDRDNLEIPEYKPKVSPIIDVSPVPVRDLFITQELEFIDRYPFITLTMIWRVPTFTKVEDYLIYQYLEGDWRLVGRALEEKYVIYDQQSVFGAEGEDIIDNSLSFKVLPRNKNSVSPDLGAVPQITIVPLGDTTKPDQVANFFSDVVTEGIQLNWDPNVDNDIESYIIRFQPVLSSGTWQSAAYSVARVPYNQLSVTVNARAGTYFIKALDTSGNFSALSTQVIASIPLLSNLNLIQELDDTPTWDGAKSGTEVVTELLRLIDSSPGLQTNYTLDGFYEFEGIIDLGSTFTSRVQSKIISSVFSERTTMQTWQPLDTAVPLYPLDDSVTESTFVNMEARWSSSLSSIAGWALMSDIDPIADIDTDWTEWQRFTIGDITGRLLQFRLHLQTGDNQLSPSVSNATVTIDMPDRVEKDNDLVVIVGGQRVLYEFAFKELPSHGFNLENSNSGDYYRITNSDVTGFDIDIFNSSNTSIGGVVDWTAQGFGRKTLSVIG